MIIQYTTTFQNYLAIDKTLTELTSGIISVDEAVQSLITLGKQEEQ